MTDTNDLSYLEAHAEQRQMALSWVTPVVLAVVLVFFSFQHYLLFHTLAELFAIIIGVLLFVMAWQTYPFSKNHFLMFLACGYLWLGALDMLHTLVYQGMNILPIEDDPNLAPQVWIATRYMEALILLSAPLFLTRALNRGVVFFGLAGIALLLGTLVLTGNFPDCFIPGQGLTPFKVNSEYIIIFLLSAALLHLWLKKEHLESYIFRLLVASIVLTMGAELAFTFYVSMYGISNLVGHLFKMFSFWLIFTAIIKTTLSEPYLNLMRDNRRLEKLEHELQETRQYLQNIIDSMPSVLIGVDRAGTITHWNREAEKISGVATKAAHGSALGEALPQFSGYMDDIKGALDEKQARKLPQMAYSTHNRVQYSDVMVYPLLANGVQGAVIRIDDVTERVRVEAMMIQTEKMLSVGGLAAGMAHEINNPLSGMLQGLQNIRRRLSEDLPKNLTVAQDHGLDLKALHGYMDAREIYNFMDDIANAGKRASNIVNNMLQFSKKSAAEKENSDVPQLIDQALSLAAVDFDLKKNYDFRTIDIKRDYSEDLPLVPCLPSEIQQVLLNIFGNAAQAMHDSPTPSRPPQITVRAFKHADTVHISIHDNGPGMNETTRSRVFDPFFTTKPPGQGTGLGLSVSYFIIHDQHQGNLSVESVPNEGATFILQLPIIGDQA